MTFEYNKAAATALRLIQKFGKVGEMRRYLDTGFDPVEGTDAAVTYSKTAATLVTVPSVDSLIRFDDNFMAALTTGKARVFLIAASGLGFTPEPGDYILHESALWVIGSGEGEGGVMPLNPNGTPVLFTVGCKKGGRDPAEGSEV